MTDKESLGKAEKKSKEETTKRRELEVKLNESKAEQATSKRLLRDWGEAAAAIHGAFLKTSAALERTEDRLRAKHEPMFERKNVLGRSTRGVNRVTARVEEFKSTIAEQKKEIARLNGVENQLRNKLKEAERQLTILQERMVEEVEKVSAPLREECAKYAGLLAAERAGRQADRQALADLWPSGHLLPSLLSRYRSVRRACRGRRG